MSKRQTRRSVSLNRDLYRRLTEFAEGRAPISQIVTQGVEAMLSGRLSFAMPVIEPVTESELEPIRSPECASRLRRPSAHVKLDVSRDIYEDVKAQTLRSGGSVGPVLDAALNRMLDELERFPPCRRCLESLEHCDCQ